MKIEIRRWDTKEILHSGDFESLKACCEDAVAKGIPLDHASLDGALLNGASLNGASLYDASLYGASFYRASLEGASFYGAILNHASLYGALLNGALLNGALLNHASLYGALLNGASLDGASLDRALLDGAILNRALLHGASFNGALLEGALLEGALLGKNTIMPDGLSWHTYLTSTVPALLTAGGKTIEEIVTSGCWECHEWSNCPMAVAFGIESESEGPPLLIPRIKEFVQFFDAGLIPCPDVCD